MRARKLLQRLIKVADITCLVVLEYSQNKQLLLFCHVCWAPAWIIPICETFLWRCQVSRRSALLHISRSQFPVANVLRIGKRNIAKHKEYTPRQHGLASNFLVPLPGMGWNRPSLNDLLIFSIPKPFCHAGEAFALQPGAKQNRQKWQCVSKWHVERAYCWRLANGTFGRKICKGFFGTTKEFLGRSVSLPFMKFLPSFDSKQAFYQHGSFDYSIMDMV